MEYLTKTVYSMWAVTGQMAPYLLFGFLMSGILFILVSPEWIERHLGGRGILPVIKSALLGVPLPLCSCGVIPVSTAIRRHGAGRGAVTAFLISTPQTGVDSILATYAMLGPFYAVFRPVAALLTGIIGGALVAVTDPENDPDSRNGSSNNDRCTDGCELESKEGSAVVRALKYGFVSLPQDIAKALLVGIAVAGVISGVIKENSLAPYLGSDFVSMLVMTAVGIPMYVCSTASIPIAVGFMHLGVSPGAALVFLITGPATNAATISVVWKVLGRRVTAIYLSTIAVGAIAAGYLLNFAYKLLTPKGIGSAMEHLHEVKVGWTQSVFAVILLAVLINSLVMRKKVKDVVVEPTKDTVTLTVKGMNCNHCVNAVTKALKSVPGVEDAVVGLDKERATVSGKNLDVGLLTASVESLGYRASILKD